MRVDNEWVLTLDVDVEAAGRSQGACGNPGAQGPPGDGHAAVATAAGAAPLSERR
ncbi:MAG: hypothetical protein ABSB01_22260 [Streptosporangiaceae bacterium]|jgi:hypothetical protein